MTSGLVVVRVVSENREESCFVSAQYIYILQAESAKHIRGSTPGVKAYFHIHNIDMT
jgi:hypothetical protein